MWISGRIGDDPGPSTAFVFCGFDENTELRFAYNSAIIVCKGGVLPQIRPMKRQPLREARLSRWSEVGDLSKMYELTMRQQMAMNIQNSPDCQRIIDKLRNIEAFLDEFDFLTRGIYYPYFTSENEFSYLSPSRITCSVLLTMESVISCCESGCIADANTLLRKYRDDLFFLLYISHYHAQDADTEKIRKIKQKIDEWTKNELDNLNIGKVLGDIASVPRIQHAIDQYNLKESFKKIGEQLNNYVHGNGPIYYNRNYIIEGKDALPDAISQIVFFAKKITVVFLFLLMLIDSPLVASEDYIDFLESGQTPPEGCQYWVAPFIEEFIKENISLIDTNCLEYLKDNTSMRLS